MNEPSKYTGLRVLTIKQTAFFLDEIIAVKGPIKSTIKLDYKTNSDVKKNTYLFALRTTYILTKTNSIIIQSEVQNIFEIKELRKYVTQERIELPWELLNEIVSICLSHSRAILAINLSGTRYNTTLLPIFDTEEVTLQFFKGQYKSKTNFPEGKHPSFRVNSSKK